jgi:hypothetical protein
METRSRAKINIGKGEDSIEGRLWFDQLAGGAVSEGVAGRGSTEDGQSSGNQTLTASQTHGQFQNND